jgi:hypothetical protein
VGPDRGRLGSVSTQLSTTLQRRSHWINPRLAQTTSLRVMDEKKEILKKKKREKKGKEVLYTWPKHAAGASAHVSEL